MKDRYRNHISAAIIGIPLVLGDIPPSYHETISSQSPYRETSNMLTTTDYGFTVPYPNGKEQDDSSPEEMQMQLDEFLSRIQPQQESFLGIIAQNNIYGGENTESVIKQQLEDYSMYSPMYEAVYEKYGIPPDVMWSVHYFETTVSRDRNPGRGKFIGAMQRAQVHSDEEVFDAIKGYEFLKLLPQRYDNGIGIQERDGKINYESSDYAEILWAGKFIYNHAQWRLAKYPTDYGDDLLSAILDVIHYDYSSADSGKYRKNKIAKLHELFQAVEETTNGPISLPKT